MQAGKRGQRLAAARDAQSTPFLISIINKVSSFRFGFWTGFFSTVQVLHEISQAATRFQRNFGLASGERAMGRLGLYGRKDAILDSPHLQLPPLGTFDCPCVLFCVRSTPFMNSSVITIIAIESRGLLTYPTGGGLLVGPCTSRNGVAPREHSSPSQVLHAPRTGRADIPRRIQWHRQYLLLRAMRWGARQCIK